MTSTAAVVRAGDDVRLAAASRPPATFNHYLFSANSGPSLSTGSRVEAHQSQASSARAIELILGE
jgi:hypothetical protein